jgi:uncharacterized protein YjiS (DUF1127 family)
LQQAIRTAARPGGFFIAGRFFIRRGPAMPSTTDDPSVSNAEERSSLRDVLRFGKLDGPRRESLGSSGQALSAKPDANVYYLARPAHDDRGTDRRVLSLVRVWWSRWLERRRFARALPSMADEVLEDYGLTRDEAWRLCRRPFWRA